MKLVEETNLILRQKCDPFDFNDPIMDPYELSEGLQKIRKDGAGVGLAAPQVGINTQALVIGMGNFETEGVEDFNQVFFNPNILSISDEQIYMIEGCLSYPGLFVKIKRPKSIVMEWWTEEDTRCEETFDGMTCRILQHEVDHLNGITFQKRAQRFHVDKAKKDKKMVERYRKRQNNDTIST